MKRYFQWIKNKDVQKIIHALKVGNNLTFKFVGGCVRDSILNKIPTDFDIASMLPPLKNIELLKQHNIKVIPLAVQYGTIIAKPSSLSFEITTLRYDLASYGRHATVDFHTDYKKDARRRDFTINALYLDPLTLKITDYFNGISDLKRGKIKFIGDINTRIHEDYLRILRYVRFFVYYGKGSPGTLESQYIKYNAHKLLLLSKERVTSELQKIIISPQVIKGVKLLNNLGISLVLFKQKKLNFLRLAKLKSLAASLNYITLPIINWLALLAVPSNIRKTLNITNSENKTIKLILLVTKELMLYRKFSYLLARYEKPMILNAILLALSDSRNPDSFIKYLEALFLEVNQETSFHFCINGNDLIALNVPQGDLIGILLTRLKEWGIENKVHSKIAYIQKAKEFITLTQS